MVKSYPVKFYIGFALVATLLYSIPVYIFIGAGDYTRSALLYLGNFLFMIAIAVFLFYIRSKEPYFKMTDLIIEGEKQVLRSIIFTFIIISILLIIESPGKYMINKPANTIHDKTNGLDFMVIVNLVICNSFAGSFATFMLASTMSGRLKRKKREYKSNVYKSPGTGE